MTKAQKAEQEQAREDLRKLLPRGSTVWMVVRHVARSGMSRCIDCYFMEPDKNRPREVVRHWLSFRVAKALGESFCEKHGGVKVGGCGMDMGFHLVHNLSYALHGISDHEAEGFDRSGYTLKQEWL